jgi:hypothetical protein
VVALAKEGPASDSFSEEDALAVTKNSKVDSNMIERVTIPVIRSSDDTEIPDRRIVELGEQLFWRSDFKFLQEGFAPRHISFSKLDLSNVIVSHIKIFVNCCNYCNSKRNMQCRDMGSGAGTRLNITIMYQYVQEKL